MSSVIRFTCAAALAVSICPAQPRPALEAKPAATIAFTEGPAADAGGNVYFTDTLSNRILRLSSTGRLTTFRENSNAANGLVFDDHGRLIACEAGNPRGGVPPRVTRTDVGTGQMEVLVQQYEGKPLSAPNDVTIDGQGRLYFTDQGRTAAVYRIDPTGRVSPDTGLTRD